MKVLIIGAGTVGQAIGALITKAGHTVEFLDFKLKLIPPRFTEYDFCHVTIPMVEIEHWVSCVYEEYKEYQINHLIIESSITPFALDDLSKLIPENLIYSPIRANEVTMPDEIQTQKKFWAEVIPTSREKYIKLLAYFDSIYPQGHQEFNSAQSLAFGKMLEVVDFGLQIMFAQQVKLACDTHGWDFEEAYCEYRRDSEYGADYTQERDGTVPQEWVKRAIFRPDVIGGKCVIQDAQLLFDADLLGPLMFAMISYNKLFKEKHNNEK